MSVDPHVIDPDLRRLAEEIGRVITEQLWEHLRKGDVLLAPEYISARQVAQLTGISPKALERMRGVREGIPYYKPFGKHRVLYRLADVRAYIERGGPVK